MSLFSRPRGGLFAPTHDPKEIEAIFWDIQQGPGDPLSKMQRMMEILNQRPEPRGPLSTF